MVYYMEPLTFLFRRDSSRVAPGYYFVFVSTCGAALLVLSS